MTRLKPFKGQSSRCIRLFFLILVFLPFCGFTQKEISIVTWNLENFGRTKTQPIMNVIAQTIKPYDLIAIQEVVGKRGGVEAVKRLTQTLNKDAGKEVWHYSVSEITTGNPYESERYAFIWNGTQVQPIGIPVLYKKYEAEIRREPYIGTFAKGRDTFTLVSFHAPPRKKQPEQEIKYLKYMPGEMPGKRLIFVGDFNTPPDNNVFNPLKKQGYCFVLHNQKTTMKMDCKNGDCMAHAYDHILYNPKQITFRKAYIDRIYRHFPDMAAVRKLSDHVPVIFIFSVKRN